MRKSISEETIPLEDIVIAEKQLEDFVRVTKIFISTLNKREKDIFIRAVLMNPPLPFAQFAQIYNVSKQRIEQIRDKIMRKFENALLLMAFYKITKYVFF